MNETKPGYLRQLDGLRALSVGAVAWSHWRLAWYTKPSILPYGHLGVEIFFVISGFLITGILLDNRSDAMRPLVLKQFYMRRFLRIFPLFYVTLAVGLLLQTNDLAETWYWHVSYLSNIYFFLHGWHGSLSHFWSLAVEEQFYLFWPLFILLLPLRFLVAGIGAIILAAPLYTLWMNATYFAAKSVQSGPDAGLLMPSCMSALGIGALIACIVRQKGSVNGLMRGLLAVGLAGMVAWHAVGAPERLQPLNRLAEDCFFGWLVYSAAAGFRGPFGWLLECAPARYLGKISYGLYIIHGFARPLATNTIILLGTPKWLAYLYQIPAVRILIFAIVTIGLASLSWHLLERRMNNLKRHFPYPLKPTD